MHDNDEGIVNLAEPESRLAAECSMPDSYEGIIYCESVRTRQ